MFSRKLRVGVIGATGTVGQRFVSLLAEHPWFELVTLAASSRSAGKTYLEAVEGRWALAEPLPAAAADLRVGDAQDVEGLAGQVDFVFCALAMPRAELQALESRLARAELPVISASSAHRAVPDVPVILPEVNPGHTAILEVQRRRLGTRRGFVVAKPNCSLQSYVPALHPLLDLGLKEVAVCTYQAVSGAGRTLAGWPEMADNVIPYIAGEEEKSEQEPMKLWGSLGPQGIEPAREPLISAQCVRVPVSDGHLAAVFARFTRKPSLDEVRARWEAFEGIPQQLGLPSAPWPFLTYRDEPDRPQPRLDRQLARGMGITLGRLRPDSLFDLRFVCLSHNTLRGAAGGAVLTAELLAAQGWLA